MNEIKAFIKGNPESFLNLFFPCEHTTNVGSLNSEDKLSLECNDAGTLISDFQPADYKKVHYSL